MSELREEDIPVENKNDLVIGEFYPNIGIYTGPICFDGIDCSGSALDKTYNLFSYSMDLRGYTFKEVIAKVNLLNFSDVEFDLEKEESHIEAIKQGNWGLATASMLMSKENLKAHNMTAMMSNGNLFNNKNRGHLKDTFCTESTYSGNNGVYFTCPKEKEDKGIVPLIEFSKGNCISEFPQDIIKKGNFRYSARFVRAFPQEKPYICRCSFMLS